MFGILATYRLTAAARFPSWFLLVGLGAPLTAADWPQYRGPNHDGVSTERIRTNWSSAPPVQLWKVSVGPALSSLAVAGGRVLSQERRPLSGQQQEFTVARHADTGAELWAVPLGIADYASGGVGSDDGPRSTPSIDGDRVYVVTSYLRVACLSASDGQVIWSHDLRTEYGGQMIPWENAASALVVGDLVLVNGNGVNQRLLAFRKQDGQLAWKGQNDELTHATPVLVTLGGVPQVVFFTRYNLVSVLPASGNVLWRQPVQGNGTSMAASPVVAGDLVYCSSAYVGNTMVARVATTNGSFTASEVWATTASRNHWSTPVHFEGHLYGMYGQDTLSFKCLDMATGTERWRVTGFGYGSVLAVGDSILALSADGLLVLVAPKPQAYTELARYRALTGKCWNVPAISNGRIYARSTLEAVALDVSLPPPPPLQLEAALPNAGTVSLRIRSSDGAPIDSSRASRIEVLTALGLPNTASDWTKLTNALVLTNGQLLTSDAIASGSTQRTYRAQELP